MKEFKTHCQQLKILRDRGFNVPTNGKPMRVLKEENYYALVNGYKGLFSGHNPSAIDQSETFIAGSQFSELYALFIFDRNLRSSFLKVILSLESQFKSILSYEFSKKYGHEHYLKLNSFNDSKVSKPTEKQKRERSTRISRINKLIAKLHNSISYSYKNKDYIKHHLNTYGSIPLWVLVNSLTFGTISTFYSLMKTPDQVNIAKHYILPKETLHRDMKALSEIRNICAHDERLYNISLSKESEIKNTRYHSLLSIPIINTKYIKGKRDLYAVIIAFKDIMKKREFSKFITEVDRELNRLSAKLKSVSKNDVLDKMGFPSNWKDIVKL